MSTHDGIAAVLLAAGGSSRLGRSKQLLEIDGQSLVRRVAAQLLDLVPDTTVVTGAERAAVERELHGLPVKQIHNEQWRDGMGASIARGMSNLETGAPAVLIMLVDQYALRPEELRRLITAWRNEPDRIVASRWDGAFGPPAIFPRVFFDRLKQLTGDTGARGLLAEHRSAVRFIDIPGAAFDIDVPDDLATMARQGS